jgi:type IV secretion system protein VirB11
MMHGETTLRLLLEPIASWLRDPETTEVVVNTPGGIGVEQKGQWSWHDIPEFTFERLDAIAIVAAWLNNRDADADHPLATGTLPDGQRFQLCLPPATDPATIAITVRKPSVRARRLDDPDFATLFSEANAGPSQRTRADAELVRLYQAKDWQAFFALAVKQRKTIGVTGSTGSGKTDLLKRLIQEVPSHLRVVSIGDVDEFGPLGPRNKITLQYGDDRAKLTAEDCIRAALRSRPDEIWLQELRGREAYAWFWALAAGHPGGCTTWHADEGNEFDALEIMVRQHPAGLAIPNDRLRHYLQTYLDVVVWCARGDDGFRAPRVWFKAAVPAPPPDADNE